MLGDEVIEIGLEYNDAIATQAIVLAAEYCAHHVGHGPFSVVARPQADGLHRHRRHRDEVIDQGPQNRRTGGGDRFPFHVSGHRGNALQKFEGRRGGQGNSPVGALRGAVAQGHGAARDVIDLQPFDADGRRCDIHDGVHRAHLMKVHLVQGHPVNASLSPAQGLENRQGPAPDGLAEPGLPEQFRDLEIASTARPMASGSVRPVVMASARSPGLATPRPRHHHLQGARRKTSAPHLAELDPMIDTEPRQVLLELFALQPQIDEGSGKHIARDAGEDIQVEDSPRTRTFDSTAFSARGG